MQNNSSVEILVSNSGCGVSNGNTAGGIELSNHNFRAIVFGGGGGDFAGWEVSNPAKKSLKGVKINPGTYFIVFKEKSQFKSFSRQIPPISNGKRRSQSQLWGRERGRRWKGPYQQRRYFLRQSAFWNIPSNFLVGCLQQRFQGRKVSFQAQI